MWGLNSQTQHQALLYNIPDVEQFLKMTSVIYRHMVKIKQ